jgi:hypothetical protein
MSDAPRNYESDTLETCEAVERWQQGKINIFDEMARLERERDEYKIGHDRYEKLRRLNLQQIKELYLKNLRTGEHFDILVDKLN